MKKWCFLMALMGWACGDENITPPKSGESFYPLQVGRFWVYQVDETLTTPTSVTQSNYDWRISVTDSTCNAEGGFTYTLMTSRKSQGGTWQAAGVQSVRKNALEVVVQQDNASFVKLAFPFSNGRAWNGNKYNNLDEEIYELVEIPEPLTLSASLSFEKVVRVNQSQLDDRIVFRDLRHEIYADEVGLVVRDVTQLEYYTDPPRLGREIVRSGSVQKMTLKDYGRK